MKGIFIFIILLMSFISQAQSPENDYPKHQFWLAMAGDMFIESNEIQHEGNAPFRVSHSAGFRIGGSFGIRFLKKIPAYWLVDVYYGTQFYRAVVRPFANTKVWQKDRHLNHCLSLKTGYEQRFKLKKNPLIQPFAAIKLGVALGLSQDISTFSSSGGTLASDGTWAYSYSFQMNTYLKRGILSFPSEFSLGVVLPPGRGDISAKIYLAYSHPLAGLNHRKTNFAFANSAGDIGNAQYQEIRNYLTFGMNFGF